MALVIDASFAAGWFLIDEANAAIDDVGRKLTMDPGLVPSLFWHELRRLMLMAHRRGRLSRDHLFLQLSRARRYPLRDCGRGDGPTVVRLAIDRNLSAHDATYLALALREGTPLATLDKALANAANAEGVAVVGPLSA